MSGKLFPTTPEEYGEIYLTPHFQLKEFYHTNYEKLQTYNEHYFQNNNANYLCAFCAAHVLEEIRNLAYDSPVKLTSGFRCEDLNEYIGGSEKSQHIWSLGNGRVDIAVDFTILISGKPMDTETLRQGWKKIKRMKKFKYHQLIFYPAKGKQSAFIHYGWPKGVNDGQAWEEK